MKSNIQDAVIIENEKIYVVASQQFGLDIEVKFTLSQILSTHTVPLNYHVKIMELEKKGFFFY